MRLHKVAVLIFLLAATSLAQDPVKTLPKAYKLQFENDWVKVVRVHYGPREKLPAHEHTQTASAYVYLNDSGPVVFKHLELPYGDVTRPPTKTGTFRLYRGLFELHEVENKSELPSDFLRVEFKTEPVNDKSLKGRYHREQYPAGENFQKVQFENEQVRVTRLVCAAGKRLDVSTGSTEPSLLIALTTAEFKIGRGNGKTSKVKLGLGDPKWIDVNQQSQLENTGIAPAELLRFDFKTRPLTKEELEKNKKHEHPKN
ncbi:MAG TPA: hypothetical protein VKA70_19390 [Blastocatellia bacterium]|nr:hypothetical protein [Blastocatellia bacterium]